MKKNLLAFAAMVATSVMMGPAWGEEVTVDRGSLDAFVVRVNKSGERVAGLEKKVTEHGVRLTTLEAGRKATRVAAAASAPSSAPGPVPAPVPIPIAPPAAPPAPTPAPSVAPPAPPAAAAPPPAPPAPSGAEEAVVRDMAREYAANRYARVLDPRRSRAEVAIAQNHLATAYEKYCHSRADTDACHEVAHARKLAELRLDQDELAAVTLATVVPPPESFIETYGGQCLMGGTLGALAAGVASAGAGRGMGKARHGASNAAAAGLITAGVTGVVFALVDGFSDVDQWGGKAALAAGCAAGSGMAVAGGDKMFRPRSQQRIVISTSAR